MTSAPWCTYNKNISIRRLRLERTQSWTDPARTFKTFTAKRRRAFICKTNASSLGFVSRLSGSPYHMIPVQLATILILKLNKGAQGFRDKEREKESGEACCGLVVKLSEVRMLGSD